MRKPTKYELEIADKVIGITWKMLLGLGGTVILTYCAIEGVFPDGLTFGDAVFLIYATFGFAIVTVIGTGYGVIASLVVFRIFVGCGNALRRKFGKSTACVVPSLASKGMIFVSLLCGLPFAVVGFLLWYTDRVNDMRLPQTMSFFVIFGFLLLCALGTRWPGKAKTGWRLISALFATLLFATVNTTHPALLNFTMSMLSIRSLPNQELIVNADDHNRLVELAKENSVAVTFCKIPNTSEWGTLDARAVWHGIGTTSYIRLLDRHSAGKRTLLVPLQSANLRVIRGESIQFSCSA